MKNKKLIAVLIVLICIIFGGIGGYFYIQSSIKKKIKREIETYLIKHDLKDKVHYQKLEVSPWKREATLYQVKVKNFLPLKELQLYKVYPVLVINKLLVRIPSSNDVSVKAYGLKIFLKGPKKELELFDATSFSLVKRYDKKEWINSSQLKNFKLSKKLLSLLKRIPEIRQVSQVVKIEAPLDIETDSKADLVKNTLFSKVLLNYEDNIAISFKQTLASVNFKKLLAVAKLLKEVEGNSQSYGSLPYRKLFYPIMKKAILKQAELSLQDEGLVKRGVKFLAERKGTSPEKLIDTYLLPYLKFLSPKEVKAIENFLLGKKPKLTLRFTNTKNLTLEELLQGNLKGKWEITN
ncbi:MAG: hypothetical protein GXO57_02340 [Thermodesulfobacteria bacterium]|nr:hypothetical protein [Thermodesulfobacteriota bacterium]